jgi:hypothetical protein
MVAQDRLSSFDRQSVVDYMTTGGSTRQVRAAGPGTAAVASDTGSMTT